MTNKYLTKTLFTIGLQCPRKLFYTLHPETYQNNKLDDPFLKALAEGGFQVGALAKIYHPEGVDLAGLSTTEAIAKTQELLDNNNVTIFEAAINCDNMLVRVDVLKKIGNTIHLYEVKAKSFDITQDDFTDKRSGKYIKSKWGKYLYDVAFQTYVLKKSKPEFIVKPYLTLVNKNAKTTVDGLNQKFRLSKDNKGRICVLTDPSTSLDSVGARVLVDVDVSTVVEGIINSTLAVNKTNPIDMAMFEDKVNLFVDGIMHDKRLQPRCDKECKKCEFRCAPTAPLKSGFDECWNIAKSTENFVFDVWNFRGSDKVLATNRILMQDLLETDFNTEENDDAGLSQASRQWLQVTMTNQNASAPYIDNRYLKAEVSKWQYPLHFIDFETASVAIPFNAGRRPYEAIAFQFSHHIVYEDGSIEHKGEYINAEPGVFPNFDLVRALKTQLSTDAGTIFRYSNHENSILCSIYDQLSVSSETDKDELMAWIQTITSRKDAWTGKRDMVDLCTIVVKSFYHPSLGGSNSLKVVLPTVLSISSYLQDKYKQPIYGAQDGIMSLNYSNHAWIKFNDKGAIIDPYESLPSLFEGMDDQLDTLFDDDEIKHGGAAMTAYAKLQFTEMSDVERNEVCQALLRYCELDTFAMVLLYEYLIRAI